MYNTDLTKKCNTIYFNKFDLIYTYIRRRLYNTTYKIKLYSSRNRYTHLSIGYDPQEIIRVKNIYLYIRVDLKFKDPYNTYIKDEPSILVVIDANLNRYEKMFKLDDKRDVSNYIYENILRFI